MTAKFLRFFTLLSLLAALSLPVARSAQAAPLPQEQSLTASPDAYSKQGEPGSTITFNFTVKGSVPGTVAVSTSNSADWTVNATPNPVTLDSGSLTASVQVSVAIPPSLPSGSASDVYVRFEDTADPSANVEVTLTASAVTTQAARPVIVIEGHSMDKDSVMPGDSFNLFISIRNKGAQDAYNLVFSFAAENFLPQENGGVVAVGTLGAGKSKTFAQRMIVSTQLWGTNAASLSVRGSYTNAAGEQYTENFSLTVVIRGYSGVAAATATPTPTGTTLPRPQLVVRGYKTDADPLQPGTVFSLDLEAQNLGSGDARGVTLVMGGGSSGVEPDPSGTPQPGGISGSASDLTTFAPLGSSNLVYLGDVAMGGTVRATQQFIVNVSANPGAYALKLSFVYSDPRGVRWVDDQVITLLVYQMPQVEINFYRDPGPMFAMQPNQLPIQVVNLGRKSAVMGNMTVTAENAELSNNTMLVGALDMGGYFPMDVTYIPQVAGPQEVTVTINYTDDFNQQRTVTQTLKVDVMDAPVIEEPGMNPEMPVEPPVTDETFWQKALRFLRGLFGLGSNTPQPETPVMPGGEMPPVEIPQG